MIEIFFDKKKHLGPRKWFLLVYFFEFPPPFLIVSVAYVLNKYSGLEILVEKGGLTVMLASMCLVSPCPSTPHRFGDIVDGPPDRPVRTHNTRRNPTRSEEKWRKKND